MKIDFCEISGNENTKITLNINIQKRSTLIREVQIEKMI